MRLFIVCCLAAAPAFQPVTTLCPQKAAQPVGWIMQSKDSSLLKPGDIAFADALEFARFLEDKGIKVKSVHHSKLESLFEGIGKAAFFRTEKGVVEVIFFPDPIGAEKVKVTEQFKAGRYLYSFQGQPNPQPGDGFDAARPMYFLTHRNWFIVPDSKAFNEALKRALRVVDI